MLVEKIQENPMRNIRIGKVVVNMGVGESGERLEKAMKVLEQLTGQKPCPTRAKRTIRDFGIRKGENIGCKVTLRKEKIEPFLKRVLEVKKFRLSESCFDDFGNISFGISEHINIPGTKYDPSLGIFGMNVCVVLERPGYRVAVRKNRRSKIGRKHRVTREEAMAFFREKLGVTIERRR
ncbi:MAG: 50S ribosomal protein L5 [Candidatus Methanomethyliaceae archaeon]|nr:50S ribosomal protein L5 [Candidatus Methanomethyliaceae archaeon]MDW7970350.1 50S ribosomal protein L5 [Nitrososphaerota archaeon]